MRWINVALAVIVSLACGALALEAGLRLIGKGPSPSIHRFDPETGWSKRPGAVGRRDTSEFDVRYEINPLGLRDGDSTSYEKPAGTYRVVCLGDSFTLGYTVEERDLFLERLAAAWRAEGRTVDLVNGGTEGWSTDQEVQWFRTQGVKFQPDLVLVFPFENDLYWNSQTRYGRFPKPRFDAQGTLEPVPASADPGTLPWFERTALGTFLKGRQPDPSGVFEVPFEATKFSLGTGKPGAPPVEKRPGRLPREWGALMATPPDFMVDAIARTGGALQALRDSCRAAGAKLVVVPIPPKAAIQQGALDALRSAVCLRVELWHPDQSVRTFLSLATQLGIPTLDPTERFRAVARTMERAPGVTEGDPDVDAPELYFERDWHLNPRGNFELARFLHEQLEVLDVGLPRATQPLAAFAADPPRPRSRTWLAVFGGLWLGLTALYYGNYRDEPKWQPPLKVAGMLAAVFAIFFGIGALMKLVPPALAQPVVTLFILAVLGFVLWKLGRRLLTIFELAAAFVVRGHWYLMPLLVVLLSIGSLLVVAASSPLVAPFIYTLF